MFKAAAPTARTMPAVLTLAALAASSAMGQFYSMGTGTSVTGISNDGRTASGRVVVNGRSDFYLWTAESGRRDFSRGTSVAAYGLSGDGRYVVGTSFEVNPRAFRWSEAGGFQDLGNSGWYGTWPTDINEDGSVIIGELHDQAGFFYQPFRWTAAGGYEILRTSSGDLINATFEAVSDDGTMAVGSAINVDRGFVWTVQSGYRLLDPLAGTIGTSSRGLGISGNGRFVVGNAGIEATGALWTPDEVINLGKLPFFGSFEATQVSEDGAIVSGTSASHPIGPDMATVWTQAGGIRLLTDHLAENGITLPMGTMLHSVTGMSSDGLTFTGTASINNQTETYFGYVVTIPAPASACTLLGLLVSCRRKRG